MEPIPPIMVICFTHITAYYDPHNIPMDLPGRQDTLTKEKSSESLWGQEAWVKKFGPEMSMMVISQMFISVKALVYCIVAKYCVPGMTRPINTEMTFWILPSYVGTS